MFFEVNAVTKRFGGLTAVADISFSIARGEIVGIFGPNGSGKTTLLNLISGIFQPTAGQLIWKDQPLNGLPPHRVAEIGIVKTFQNPKLFQELSVAEHVWIAAHLRLKRALGVRRITTLIRPARHDETLRRQVESVLRLCRLTELRDESAAISPMATRKCLASRWRSCASRNSCCSMSRRPALATMKSKISTACCATCASMAPRFALSTTRSRSLALSRIAPSPCITAARLPRARPRRCLMTTAVIEAYLGRQNA